MNARLTHPPLETLAKAVGASDIRIEWLAGDGSDRCYYRIFGNILGKMGGGEGQFVLMQLSAGDAEKLQRGEYEWIAIEELLESHHIRVPKLYAALKQEACLIIEDYGDLTFESRAKALLAAGQWEDLCLLYGKAARMVTQFLKIKQSSSQQVWTRRAFDKDRYTFETDFFMHHFGKPIANLNFSAEEEAQYKRDLETFAGFLSGFSKYFVHRDFHSRNLMMKDDELAVIDFQDARLGSPAYDLVSLYFDSYVPLNFSQRIELFERGLTLIEQELPENIAKDIRKHWRACLLQRQLKAIGSFGYLTLVKNRGNYLKNVVPAFETLPHDTIYDERWPFLSKGLFDKLKHFKQTNAL